MAPVSPYTSAWT